MRYSKTLKSPFSLFFNALFNNFKTLPSYGGLGSNHHVLRFRRWYAKHWTAKKIIFPHMNESISKNKIFFWNVMLLQLESKKPFCSDLRYDYRACFWDVLFVKWYKIETPHYTEFRFRKVVLLLRVNQGSKINVAKFNLHMLPASGGK